MEVNISTERKQNNAKTLSPVRIFWNRFKKNKLAIVGLSILIVMILFSVVGPFITGYKSDTMDYNYINVGPSINHLLGTDAVGRDVLTRVMLAGRISLAVGLVSVIVEFILGTLLGVIAGYYGGIIDSFIMRIVDIMFCIPTFPILIVLGIMLTDFKVDPSLRIILLMFILGFLDWPGLCRIVRGEILSLREQEYMQATEALGLPDRRKMFRHLLPNTLPIIIVTETLSIGGAILSESSLSYLGFGVVPPVPSWGNMIEVLNDFYTLQHYWWLWISPGLAIVLTVVAINLLGDGLRDALDPRLKS